MKKKFIPKKRKLFNENHLDSTELSLLKDILFKLEENKILQQSIKNQSTKTQKNTFNILLILIIPIILSILIYSFIYLKLI